MSRACVRFALARVLVPLGSTVFVVAAGIAAYVSFCGKSDREYWAGKQVQCEASCDYLASLTGTPDRREWLRHFRCDYPCTEAQLTKVFDDEVADAQRERADCRKSCEQRCSDPIHRCP